VGTGTQAGTAISGKSVTRTQISSDGNAYFYYVVKNPSVAISGTDKVPRLFAGNNTGNPQGTRYSAPGTGLSRRYSDSGPNADVTDGVGGSISSLPSLLALQVHSL
jgi:hypothetical protein